MPLSAKDPIAKWIDDFKKSDAPQFKGKSGEDRKAMAIAAYMDAKKGAKQEKGWDSEVRQVESTDAYAKSQAAIRDRKKRAGMTSSDQKKMGAVADMMRREREKRAQQRNEEVKEPTGDLKNACWKGYTAVGTKKKNGKTVPNCVPEELKKVECPKCEGEGCSHCDDKGYHMTEKTNNLVAKHARKYNKAHVMANRKKKQKKGYVKHRGKAFQEEVETDSAAKKPVTITDPKTGKKRVRMQPAHRKELDHDHKKEVGEQVDEVNKGFGQRMKTADVAAAIYSPTKRKPDNREIDKIRAKYRNQKKNQPTKEGIEEATMSKVEIDGLPTLYVDGAPSEVKVKLRKMLRNKDMIRDVSRATKVDARKSYRDKASGKEGVKESMDPRDHTDKPGHLVVVTKPSGRKMIKHYHPTSAGAQKYADRINKTNRVGHKATVHRTDGRRIMEEVSEFLVVKKNPSFSGSSSSSSSSSRSRRGAGTTSSQSVTTTSGNGYKIKRNIKTGKTTKSRYNVGGSAAQKESTNEAYDKSHSAHRIARKSATGTPGARAEYHKDGSATIHSGPHGPRTSTDNVNSHLRDIGAEHGHSTKELGKKHVTKHDGHTHTVTAKNGGAGHTIHIKPHGVKEETIAEATSQKLLNKMKELAPKGQLPRNSAELRKLKARAQEELRSAAKAKKAAPKKQSTTKTSTGKKHMGSMEAGDRNIVMQLRKAQDLKGNHDIIVSPKGRTTRLPKAMIDKLLKRFDSLQKPQEKRKFQIMVTKELRKRAK